MSRNTRSVVVFTLSALIVCLSRVADVSAAPPTEVVMLVCADYGTSTIVYYDASPSAPAQTAGASCATQLASLQSAGFTNVNVTVQTYVASSAGEVIGAPGGVNGTYTTYVLANGSLSSGNL